MTRGTRISIWDWAAGGFLLLLLVFLFHETLFFDRALLSIDTRLWPPFSGKATDEVFTARADMIHSDLPGWMMPETLLANRMMDQGIPPIWTPYTLGGMPLLAGLAYPAYYPPNFLLNRVLDVHPLRSLGILTVFHLAAAGLGMYFFLRLLSLSRPACLLGAIALAASAWYITHAYIPTFLNAAAWIPLLFYLGEKMVRGRAFGLMGILLALVAGLSFLGGFPQTTFIGLYGAGLWIAARTLFSKDHGRADLWEKLAPIAAFGLAAVVGIGISTAELLPAAEFKAHSLRDQDYPLSVYKENALESPALVGQVVPGFFGHPVDPEGGGGHSAETPGQDFLTFRLFLKKHVQNNFMENALYIGVLPFMLALAALWSIRRSQVRIFLLLSAFALLTALGTPLLDLVYHGLPGLRVGGPKRILILHTLAFAGLAAFGLDRLFVDPEKRPRPIWTILIMGLGLAGAALLALGFSFVYLEAGEWVKGRASARGVPVAEMKELESVLVYLRRILWPPVIAILLFGLARNSKWLWPASRIPAYAVIGLVTVELAFFGRGFITTQPLKEQYPATEVTQFLKREIKPTEPYRVASFELSEVLMPNLAAVHGIQCVGGVSGLVHRRYGEYCHALDPALINMDDPRFVGAFKTPESLASPMLDLLGVRYIAISNPDLVKVMEENGFTLAFREDREGMALFENPEALPRVFAVAACRVAGEGGSGEEHAKKEALEWITSKDFDPSTQVILEDPPPEGFADEPGGLDDDRAPEAAIEEYGPLYVKVNVHMHQTPGFLVLTDVHYPGWEARVDGNPVPILRADYAFRAVNLEEGIHIVEFTYKPKSRSLGIVASGFSFGLLLLWGLVLILTRFSVFGGGSVIVLGSGEETGEEETEMDPEAEAPLEAEEGPLEEISARAAGGEAECPEEGFQGPAESPEDLRP